MAFSIGVDNTALAFDQVLARLRAVTPSVPLSQLAGLATTAPSRS